MREGGGKNTHTHTHNETSFARSKTKRPTVKALEKCRDMQERMTLVLKDMTERLASDLIAPLTVFVEEQGGSVKEACRKVDKTQEKRKHASLNPGTNALSYAKSSTISKTDLKALELVNSFCNAASVECVRMFTLLFKSSSFVLSFISSNASEFSTHVCFCNRNTTINRALFRAGNGIVNDMDVCNDQMKRLLHELDEGADGDGADGGDGTAAAAAVGNSSSSSGIAGEGGDESREAAAKAVAAVAEFEKNFMVQLSRLMALKAKMEADAALRAELDACDLFGNIEDMVHFHAYLLTNLEKNVLSEYSVAALCDVLDGARERLAALHRAYVLNHSVAVFHAKQLRSTKHIEQYVKAVQMRDTAETLKLTEMLALPCRYVHKLAFLMKALQDALAPGAPGAAAVAALVGALHALEETLEDAKAQSDRVAQLTRVSQQLPDYPDDMTMFTQRTVVCEGDVTLLAYHSAAAAGQELASRLVPGPGYHLFLFSDVLIMALRTAADASDGPANQYSYVLQMPVFSIGFDEDTAMALPQSQSQAQPHQHVRSISNSSTSSVDNDAATSTSDVSVASTCATSTSGVVQQQQALQQQQASQVQASQTPPLAPSGGGGGGGGSSSGDDGGQLNVRTLFRLSEPRGAVVLSVDSELQRSAWFAHLRAAVGSRRRTQVFGVPLADIMARGSEQANDIPSFVAQCIDFLSTENVLNTEGLFRLSGNLGEIARLRGMVDSGAAVELRDVHVAASLLKTWLNVLPQPLLLTVECGAQPIAVADWGAALQSAAGDPNKFDLVRLLGRLAQGARFVACALFRLLCKVVQHSPLNRMDVHNIGIVFAPTLFKNDAAPDPILANTICTELVAALVEHYERVFSSTILEQSKYAERMRILQARAFLERAGLNTRAGRSPRLASLASLAARTTGSPTSPHAALAPARPRSGAAEARRRAVSCVDTMGSADTLLASPSQPSPPPGAPGGPAGAGAGAAESHGIKPALLVHEPPPPSPLLQSDTVADVPASTPPTQV